MPGERAGGGSGAGGRLAVLPLVAIGPEAGEEYFADGMTEELISTLSRLSGLRTIARTSAMRYRGSTKSASEIGKELDVRTVLEGSVRKAGEKLRIALQLVDTSSQELLWSATYDRELRDVFAVQRDVARRVAKVLKVRVPQRDSAQLERPTTDDVDAYTLYLKGRVQWNLRTDTSLLEAIQLFEQALAKDGRFALALAGIADAAAARAVLEFAPPTQAFPAARTAAERAIAIDPLSAEAHAALGLVRFQYERDWEGAERELRRAIELNPNYPAAHQYLADHLKAMGRFDEATAEMRTALELDPLSLSISTGLGHVLYLARRYDAAIEQYRRALAMDPRFALAHLWFGRPFLQQGRFDEAIAEIRQAVDLSGGGTMARAVLAHALASAGQREEAEAILADLKARADSGYLPSYWIALIFTGLGDSSSALRWLDRAFEERSSWLVWIGVEPRFDALRASPGFRALLARMRLEEAERRALSGGGSGTGGPEVAGFLRGIDDLRLGRYRVLGAYTRHDERLRNRLKDLCQRIAARFEAGGASRDNFLLWGAPGSGKTFLVQEVAASLPAGVRWSLVNLAEAREPEFRSMLEALRDAPEPLLCLIDEIDSQPDAPWPYEALLPSLDLARPARAPRVFVLAGSSGSDLEAMRQAIAARPKGADLLSRIPRENEFVVPPLGPTDRVLVAAGTLRMAARRSGRPLAEVEKLALYYLAVQPELGNPRQLRDRATRAIERLPPREDRLRFDQLFHAGDSANKEFWLRTKAEAPELIDSFLRVAD